MMAEAELSPAPVAPEPTLPPPVNPRAPDGSPLLTDRQAAVFGCLAVGWKNQRTAAALGISSKTVSAHLEQIKKRLGVDGTVGVAVAAGRMGGS